MIRGGILSSVKSKEWQSPGIAFRVVSEESWLVERRIELQRAPRVNDFVQNLKLGEST